MFAFYVVLGILVGVILAGVLPWFLLRKLEGEEDAKGEEKWPLGKPQLWHIAMPLGGSRPPHHKRTLMTPFDYVCFRG